MLSQSEETKEQHQVLFLRGQETQERLRKIPGFSFFGQRRPKNKKQFSCVFFLFDFIFKHFFCSFRIYSCIVYFCDYNVFLAFLVIFFLYRIWYWAWNGNRGEKHFPFYVTGWKIGILFYKGGVVIVVIVEEFVYIFFYMSHQNGVFVCLKSKIAGVYNTPFCKKRGGQRGK